MPMIPKALVVQFKTQSYRASDLISLITNNTWDQYLIEQEKGQTKNKCVFLSLRPCTYGQLDVLINLLDRKDLGLASRLRHLDLSSNHFTHMPEATFKLLTGLKSLNCVITK